MKRKLKVGSTSQIVPIRIDDTSSTTGGGLTGLTYNSSGLAARYKRSDQTAWQPLTLATPLGIGQWVTGGLQELGRGVYELSLPDVVLSAGSWTVVQLYGAANMADVNLEIELDAVNYQDGSAFGLSRLDTTVGSRLATAGYTAPDNATIATIAAQTDTVEAALATLLTRVSAAVATDADLQTLLARVPGTVALEATLTAIQGTGWSDETLKSLKEQIATRSTLTAPEVWLHSDRTLTDKTDFSLASTEHAALIEAVDTQLSGTHGAGSWTQEALTGAYTVTVVVRSQSTSGALAGVRVTLKEAEDATVLDQKWTDSSGSVQFTLDAATYQLHLGNVAGYESRAALELVITGTETVTYYLNPVSVSTATDPALCVVYGYVYQNGVPVAGTDVTAKLTSKGAIVDEILLSIQTLTDTTNASGYFELELVRSDQFAVGTAEYKIVIEASGINQVVEIPNQSSVNLADLLRPQL